MAERIKKKDMSAIGISPCPPFVHQQGAPGVLWDGNTVAWYKHNDPVAGCFRDGANRVSAWYDKMNYAVGPEQATPGQWYTVPWWTGVFTSPPFTQVGNAIHADGTVLGATCIRAGMLIIGATYRVIISVVRAGGTGLQIDDGVAIAGIVNATGTYTFHFTAQANNFILRDNAFYVGDVTYLSVRRIFGNTLLQPTAASQPIWSAANGVLFDGVNDFMKTLPFVFVQPEFIYFVGRQITWANNDYIFDGNIDNVMLLMQRTISPRISLSSNAGVYVENDNLVLNTFSIVRCLVNGVNSSLQVNNTAIVINDAALGNAGGFTLGKPGAAAALYSNIEVKEIILRRTADNAATQASIYNYLKNINSVP